MDWAESITLWDLGSRILRKDLDLRKMDLKMYIFDINVEEIAQFRTNQVMKSKYSLIKHQFLEYNVVFLLNYHELWMCIWI